MKVRVDPELCVATGSCESICPEIFVIGPSGIAEVKSAEVPPDLETSCREAVAGCPVDAIIIED